MRTVLGAVYGALIAFLIAVVLDILAAGSLLSPEGTIPSWYDSVKYVVAAILISLGLVWGTWQARRGQVNTRE
jgi:uncharacterized membrane protein